MAVQLLFCTLLLPGFVENSSEYSCEVSIQLFFPSVSLKGQVVRAYSSTDKAIVYKNSRFILSERSDIHMIVKLLIAVHALIMYMIVSLSIDETELTMYINWATNF